MQLQNETIKERTPRTAVLEQIHQKLRKQIKTDLWKRRMEKIRLTNKSRNLSNKNVEVIYECKL